MVLWFWYIFAILVTLAFVQHLQTKRKNQLVANLPGPFNFILIGNSHKLMFFTPQNFFKRVLELRKKWGKVFRVWVFHRLIIAISDPKLAEVVLTSPSNNIKKHRLYKLFTPWLGVGLVGSDGQKWHSRRKIISSAFHFRMLEEFVEVFDRQSKILVEQLKKHCNTGKEFDVNPFIGLAALDIITETAMGTKINAQTDPTNEFSRVTNEITEIMSLRFLNPPIVNDFIFSIFFPKLSRKQNECIKILHNFSIKVIEDRRRELQDALQQNRNQQNLNESKQPMVLLDILLQSTHDGKPLTNEDIREEVDTFMFAGHDTTAITLSFALTQLARHPNVQQKLYEEISQVLDSEESNTISYKLLQELKYTECVIKETLRLYPTVPVVGRELLEDLKYDGGILPAGSEVFVALWLLGIDGDCFENPEEFKPERHLDDANERTRSFSFIPFSAGTRACIGQKYAMLEMKCILLRIIEQFEVLPLGEDVKPCVNIILSSENGFQIGLQHRNKNFRKFKQF